MRSVPFELKEQAVVRFKAALLQGNETSAHRLLGQFPGLMRDILPQVGHHGMWACNKPHIRPRLANGKPGKIPDFLLAGRGSGGKAWFIVELKSPADKLFNKDSTAFSTCANKALNQLASYLQYATEKQGSIRDALEIAEFTSPQGILVIGREDETIHNEIKQQMKSFWNKNFKNIQIVSYDRILMTAQQRLKRT